MKGGMKAPSGDLRDNSDGMVTMIKEKFLKILIYHPNHSIILHIIDKIRSDNSGSKDFRQHKVYRR